MINFDNWLSRMAALVLAGWVAALPGLAQAQSIDPFENGWILDPSASELRVMSVKKGNIAETSRFDTLTGLIAPDGRAQVRVLLDSVDTKIDLRNVRMRFLFFETFNFPEASIDVALDSAVLTDLHNVRRKVVPVTYRLNLRDVTSEASANVAVTLISNDRVTVTSTTPIAIQLSDFNLMEGRNKLQEAANVDITPLGIVSFEFVFDRASPGTPPDPELLTVAAAAPASAALETKGTFDRDACIGRFDILSRTGNITFRTASARLSSQSFALLDNIHDIVNRCPDLRIEISGHTDSDGSNQANQQLSERRAGAVAAYLQDKGVAAARIEVVGYGESKPLVPNSNRENKARNRRIEFTVLN